MRSVRPVLWMVVVVLIFPTLASSQITITSSDFLGMIGSTQTTLEDERMSIPIDVGSAGSNQTWDFRTQIVVDSVFAVSEFLTPQQAQLGATFPGANMVQKITTPIELGFELFNAYNVTPMYFIDLGDSTQLTSPFDTAIVHYQNDTVGVLPIAYNNTWMSTERDTTGFFPINANISVDTTINAIDGWGTVRLPMGDFECLRMRQDVKVINQTIINGQVFGTTTETYIQYNWVSKGAFMLARAQSQNGETNPNFTDAHGYGRLDELSSVVSVTDGVQRPAVFELSQNYPNPFNPSTTVDFALPEASWVSLTIYTALGEEVATLVNGELEAGRHSVTWNAGDAASGVYFYRMQVGPVDGAQTASFAATQKLILLR